MGLPNPFKVIEETFVSKRESDQDQQAKYPGDLGMQYATTVSSKTIVWPASEWFE